MFVLIVFQINNTLLIGGAFTTVGGQTHNRVARLKADCCTTAPPGLSAWYKGEFNADDSIWVQIMEYYAVMTSYTTGKVGQAFNFDGNGDSVRRYRIHQYFEPGGRLFDDGKSVGHSVPMPMMLFILLVNGEFATVVLLTINWQSTPQWV